MGEGVVGVDERGVGCGSGGGTEVDVRNGGNGRVGEEGGGGAVDTGFKHFMG